MNETEFLELLSKAATNLDGKSILYTVVCGDCISYREIDIGPIKSSIQGRGRMDARNYEFKNKEAAQAAIDLHHPYLSSKPIVEYLIHTYKYMMRYRQTYAAEDTIRIHSINGHTIASDKCAYICQLCGAIYQSKDYYGYTLFDTNDPRCQTETHGLQELKKFVYVLRYSKREEREEQQTKIKSIEWWNTHPSECHVCHKPFFAPGHVYETFNPTHTDRKKWNRNYQERLERRTKYWHLLGAYDDVEHASYIPVQKKLVCEDCYYASPQYKDSVTPLDKKRYLSRKRARKQLAY
jgi:hypothetical protein